MGADEALETNVGGDRKTRCRPGVTKEGKLPLTLTLIIRAAVPKEESLRELQVKSEVAQSRRWDRYQLDHAAMGSVIIGTGKSYCTSIDIGGELKVTGRKA